MNESKRDFEHLKSLMEIELRYVHMYVNAAMTAVTCNDAKISLSLSFRFFSLPPLRPLPPSLHPINHSMTVSMIIRFVYFCLFVFSSNLCLKLMMHTSLNPQRVTTLGRFHNDGEVKVKADDEKEGKKRYVHTHYSDLYIHTMVIHPTSLRVEVVSEFSES